MSILYELAMWVLALAAIPKILYQRIFHGKYRNSLTKRLGFGFPNIVKDQRKVIWVHAVSVGETKAVAVLAKQLKARMNNAVLIVSSITETGHTEAQRSMPFADYHVYLPVDLYGVINPIIKRVKPDLVLLVESDFWLHFLRSCKRYGAKVALVNGKMSERSMQRFQKFQNFSKLLFSQIDLFCMQNRIYEKRFLSLGIPQEQIHVTGNMKFDESYPRLSESELLRWKSELGISEENQVLVVGSSHHPEEEMIVERLASIWKVYPKLKALIVPRHPERFLEVGALLAKRNIPYIAFSKLPNKTGQEKVILVDAMGQLRKCYQLADIAFVAGSFTDRVGGHNIIEPCWYGVPVLFGPHMRTQPELVSLVNEYHAGIQVDESEFVNTVIDLLDHPEKRAALGEGGRTLMADMQGATSRTLTILPHF